MVNTAAKNDREETSPFNLQVFYRAGAFPSLTSLPPTSTPHESSITLSTWPSATLHELSLLLTPLIPSHLLSEPANHPDSTNPTIPDPPSYNAVGTRLAYRLAYPSPSPHSSGPAKYQSKDLGTVAIGSDPAPKEAVLGDCGFVVGDYMLVAILRGAESVAPVPDPRAAPPRPLYAGPRRDGEGVRMPADQWARGAGRGGRGGQRGGYNQGRGGGSWARQGAGEGAVPQGEWRRGEALPPNDDGRGPTHMDYHRQERRGGGGRGRGGGGGRERW